ncbi:hypothetical protein F9C07_2137270, partial [Aspergillus flavus]
MPTHPYYSTMAEIPNYIPNDKRTFELVSIFALTCSIILTITYAFVLTKHPQISKSDLLTTLWFVLFTYTPTPQSNPTH